MNFEEKVKAAFITLEDGYTYYWIVPGGAVSASELRKIADMLDKENAGWHAQIERDLGNG